MADRPKTVHAKGPRDSAPVATVAVDLETLRQEIELHAYYRYCERGCAPGADVNDWLAAEQEVLAEHATPAAPKGSAGGRRHRRHGMTRE